MRVRRTVTGEILPLDNSALLGKGGEALVYRVPTDPTLVAKVWHKPTPERAAKVEAMVRNPPLDPTAAQHHTSIAWPSETVADARGTVVGFLMPFVGGMRPIIDFFNPKTRRQTCPLFNHFYLHRTARNLVIALRALHERGYVVGDLNESNILVAETALVTVVDTDSFQVWDAEKGRVYRCRVGKPDFTPPELQGKTFGQFDRNVQHDLFGLSTLLFQLLMEGTHPFSGNFTGHGESPPLEARIAAGHFPYAAGAGVPYTAKPTAPPLEMLYPALQHLFVRCFQDGHSHPSARPDTSAWQWGLEEAETALVSCWANDQHIYSGHLTECPWCRRTKLLGGRDPFPSASSVTAGTHIGPAVAPPRTSGQARPIPLPPNTRPNLPAPPVPLQRMPSSTGRTRPKPRGFAGFPARENYSAWLSIGCGVAGWLAWFAFSPLPFAGIIWFIGLICGALALQDAFGFHLAGRGWRAAVVGLALNGLGFLVTAVPAFLRSVKILLS